MSGNATLGWWTRLFKVKAGLGSGEDAGTFETIMEGPEWLGAYGSAQENVKRRETQHAHFLTQLQKRFPNERLTLISLNPISGRKRARWED
jgi:hypothetical protein